MKSIEYYCGKYFNPQCGQILSAEEWLENKIESAKKLRHELVHVHHSNRDGVRINRITKAIDDWSVQLDEIHGIEKDV